MGKLVAKKMLAGALAVAFALCLAACAGGAEGGGDEGLAARWDGGSITEDEVTAYTAQFREQHAYDDDDTWAQYLAEQELTAETWRNRAIGQMVEARLLAQAAEESGIVADEADVDERLAQAREALGVQTDEEWESYLSLMGSTPEDYRAQVEQAVLEQQLLLQELHLDTQADAELCDAYIEDNLISRVVRRYRTLAFAGENEARSALDELQALAGEAREGRWAELAESDGSQDTTAENMGDVGWDLANDWGSVQQELNEEMVPAGALSASVHEGDGVWYVLWCTDRFVFEEGTTFDDLPDEDLQGYVNSAALYDSWDLLVSDYIAGLRDAAHVQVREMPAGLPYDVDDLVAQKQAS